MFAALSDILDAAVTVGVDTAAGLLFDTEGSAGLASLRQSAEDLTEPDGLRRAAETLCHAAEDDEQRRQLLAPDGAEADQFFMDLLLRSICSSDVTLVTHTEDPCNQPTHTWGIRALAAATDAMNGMRSHTRRVIVGSLMSWLEPLVALAQSDNLPVQEWANQVLERVDIYSHREMRQHVQRNGFAVLRCLASASQARGAQRAAAAALVSILQDDTGQQNEVVQGVGMHAILSLAASVDDHAWDYTVLAVASVQANATQLVLSSEDLQSQPNLSNHEIDGTATSAGREGSSCLQLLVQLVHDRLAGTNSKRSVEDRYRMQSFCVGILARAAATEGVQQVLVDAGATAALISAARTWLHEFARLERINHDSDAVDHVEDASDHVPVQVDDILVAVLATANLAETAGFAERTFVHCNQANVNESGLDGLLGLIQDMLVVAHAVQAAVQLLQHAARILSSLAHSAQESGYIGSWIIGAIFDKGLLLPLERIIREECTQETGSVHPGLMRYVASSLAELAKAHGTPMYSRSGTADPQLAGEDSLPHSLTRGHSGAPLLARGSSSGLSTGLARGNSGLSDFEDGPSGSMSSLRESWSNLSEIVTGSARSLGLLPAFQVAGSGSFRVEGGQDGSMCIGRRFSSVCADEPAAMLPRVVQECQRSGVSAGWIARLAKYDDPDVQRCAALTYSSISGTAQAWLVSDDDDNTLNELADVLLALSVADSVETRKSAKMTIVALAKFSEEYRTALVAHASTLKPVLLMLTKSVDDMHVDKRDDLLAEQRLAASILRYIIGSDACREMVMRGPLADVVASVLRLHDDVEISTQMSFVFANISSDPETKQKLDSEFIGALQHMMQDEDTQSETVQMNAVAAVRHVASEPRLQSLLLSMGIVPILVRLASSQTPDVQRDAKEALTALAETGGALDQALAMVNNGVGLSRQTSEGSDNGTDIGLDGGITDIKESQIEIYSSLGKGAYGEVFRGRWRGSDVAIKCMTKRRAGINDDPKIVDREQNLEFRNEVHLLMQARHPNIVLLMGTMASSRRLCIVSELCHRGSLYRVLHQTTGSATKGDDRARSLKSLPPWSKRLQMMHDAASGCHFLHSSEPCIVHLDLKSPNLLVDKNWNVKVADFGLARLKQHFFVDATGPVGTPEWTAPEVLKSKPFNESADVYSFGVVLWEMATRAKPFSGIPGHVVVAKVISGQKLPRPTEEQTRGALPNGYMELMYACMSPEWQDRPKLDAVRSRLLEIHNDVHASESAARAARGGPGPRARPAEDDAGRTARTSKPQTTPPEPAQLRQVGDQPPAPLEPTPDAVPKDVEDQLR